MFYIFEANAMGFCEDTTPSLVDMTSKLNGHKITL